MQEVARYSAVSCPSEEKEQVIQMKFLFSNLKKMKYRVIFLLIVVFQFKSKVEWLEDCL